MSLFDGEDRKAKEARMRAAGRLPPGQHLTEKWPVLHEGAVPRTDLATWDLRVFGLVDTPLRLSWEALRGLPVVETTSDIHCVTTWSKFDCRWHGVSVRALAERFRPKPEARFALVHAEGDYTTNLPLADLLDESVLLAFAMNGEPLAAEHGGPLRLVVPKLYFWKSAKWVRGIELLAEDRLGFWERGGYHRRGDPWKSERHDDD
jgi:DMSO/TMAO reductase YedYZ molybdopterin-dependent catalytic subunit